MLEGANGMKLRGTLFASQYILKINHTSNVFVAHMSRPLQHHLRSENDFSFKVKEAKTKEHVSGHGPPLSRRDEPTIRARHLQKLGQ